MATVAERRAELLKRAELGRPLYERAKAQLSGTERAAFVQGLFAQLQVALGQFRPGDTGEKALYVLGQIAMIVAREQEPHAIVVQYDDLREQIKKLEP